MDFQWQPIGVMEKCHLFSREVIGTNGFGFYAQTIEFGCGFLHGIHPKGKMPKSRCFRLRVMRARRAVRLDE